MSLDWIEMNGDATAKRGVHSYEIEQAGADIWWAFKDGKPAGTYRSIEAAKSRLEQLADQESLAHGRSQIIPRSQ